MRGSVPYVVLLGLLVGTILVGTQRAEAQVPGKRIAFGAENLQARNRLQALDRQNTPLGSPLDVGKFAASAAATFPLGVVTGLVLEGSPLDKWEQLLDEYLKLLDELGDALVPPASDDAASRQFGDRTDIAASSIQTRRLVHLRIAALPLSVLDLYRSRVDAQAKKLLDDGKRQRSAGPLRRLVDDYFCSRWTDQALDFLGDLAFEEGGFEDALAWWSQITGPPNAKTEPGEPLRPASLVFPQPNVDVARVQAKQILAYAFAGQAPRASQLLEAFRARHPQAHGALAGSEGAYADILQSWVKKAVEHGGASNYGPWTTFAGNPARNRALSVCPSYRLWIDGPSWRVKLPRHDQAAPSRGSPAALLAYHPLVVGPHVLIADARSVLGYDLLTGRQVFDFVLREPGPQNDRAREGRYTLTAWNNRVFARLGRQTFGPGAVGDRQSELSTIVCLSLAGPQPGELLWRIAAAKPDDGPAFFEGAPLAADGRVYTAVSWLAGQRTHTAVACFDAQSGQRRWWQEVCETPEFENVSEPRRRQHLLTLGGGRLYYCSHSGAVIALDPWSGQCLWATRYKGGGPSAPGVITRRELAPCVYADSRLYVAPIDSNCLLCLDAASGILVWERQGLEVTHLLGVSRGRVYFTTPRGLRCLMADTGLSQGCWLQPAEGTLPGLGRGLLAGRWLLWPTQDPKLPLRGVTLAEGLQERFDLNPHDGNTQPRGEPEYLEPTMLRAILPGNMAFGQDCLVVAGVDEVAAYVPQKRFLQARELELKQVQKSAKEGPKSWRAGSVSDRSPPARSLPLAIYRLAMSQADAGLTAAAEKNLNHVRDLAKGLCNEATWQGLAQARLAELRGDKVSGWPLPSGVPPTQKPLASERPPAAARSLLELPLQRWLEIPASQFQALTHPDESHPTLLLGQRGDKIFCLDTLAGTTRWARSVLHKPFTHSETLCLAALGNVALRVGPEHFVGLKLAEGNREALWTQPVPLQPTVPYYLDGNEPRRLSNPFPPEYFRCNNHLFYFMVDRRLLVALDPVSGHFAWHLWAPGGPIRPLEGGRFSAHYHADDRFVIVQTTAGKWLVLDSSTGACLHEGPAATPWLQPPLALDDHRFVLCEGAGRVMLLNAATGMIPWTFEPTGYTSRTGASAQVFGTAQYLLAVVPRNIGPELVCLEAARGTPLWRVPLLPGQLDPQTASVDDEAVFFVIRNTLQARSLKDGMLRWKQSLPGAFPAWQTVRVGSALLVYPLEKLHLFWLPLDSNPWSLPLICNNAVQPGQDRSVLFLEPRTGQWMQRLWLPRGRGPVTVLIQQNRLVAACGGELLVFRPLENH